MSPNKRTLLTFVSFILVLVTIACSCGSLTPTSGSATSVPSGGVATSTPSSGGATSEAIPGMEGSWEDMKTYDTYAIVWINGNYQIYDGINADATSYTATDVKWSNGSLTWTYSTPGGPEITFTTVTLSGDTLLTKWSSTDGTSGNKTLTRVQGTP